MKAGRATLALFAALAAALPAAVLADAPKTGAPAPAIANAMNGGTTIVGDRDTALGLYLTPWKDEGPAAIDRPPIRFHEAPAPVDVDGNARRTQNEEAFAGYRRSRTELGR